MNLVTIRRGSAQTVGHFEEEARLTVMRIRWIGTLLIAGLLTVAGCSYRETPEERSRDANTPAGKMGQAAHKVAVEAGKATRVVGNEINKAAHDAREGWKEASRKNQQR